MIKKSNCATIHISFDMLLYVIVLLGDGMKSESVVDLRLDGNGTKEAVRIDGQGTNSNSLFLSDQSSTEFFPI